MSAALQLHPLDFTETTPLPQPAVSVIIVSFNTRDLTRECLTSLDRECTGLDAEIFVVDNASRDGSADMVAREFPHVQLIRSDINLGFGNANNQALTRATGRFIVLLNSDAFFKPGALHRAIRLMETNPACGLAGARLVGRDGELQPSARMFHTVLRDAFVLTGLAAKFPASRLFGSLDRTWADPTLPAAVDWVPGAFSILRPEALTRVGLFDPAFFLYYEEVDLCRRIQQAGYQIWYWPEVEVLHIGGESSRQLKTLEFSSTAAQVVLWRMRSTLLYYRKHHGAQVHLAYALEYVLFTAAMLRNRFASGTARRERYRRFSTLRRLLQQAWQETDGGLTSPPAPW